MALDFYREPRRYPHLLDAHQPLPAGITALLAAPTTIFSEEQIKGSATELNASVAECREVVPFFIKQVLIDTPGDHYRVLGLTNTADSHQIKQHYHYIIRLFHPDWDGDDENWDDIYAPRINEAYNALRNRSNRLKYDQSQLSSRDFEPVGVTPPRATYRPPIPRDMNSRHSGKTQMSSRLKKLAMGMFVVISAGFAFLVLSQSNKTALRMETGNELAAELGGSESNIKGQNKEASIEAVERVNSSASTLEPPQNNEQEQAQAQISVEEMIRQRVAEATATVSGGSSARRIVDNNESRPPPMPGTSRAVADIERAPDAASENTEKTPASEPAKKTVSKQQPVMNNGDAKQLIEPVKTPAIKAEKDNGSQVSSEGYQSKNTAKTPVEVMTVEVKTSKPKPKVVVESEPVEAQISLTEKATPVAVAAVTASPPYPPVGKRETKIATTKPKLGADSQQPGPSKITNQQTWMLLAAMMSSYQNGDLKRFMSLFTEDARTESAYGKPQIYVQYKAQFAKPEQRKITITKLSWKNIGLKDRIGSGALKLEITPFDSGAPASNSTSPITLGVKLTPSGVKIKSLIYKGN